MTSARILGIRAVTKAVSEQLRRGAQARGLTVAEYLERLLELHQAARARADAGDEVFQAELQELGLQSVSQ